MGKWIWLIGVFGFFIQSFFTGIVIISSSINSLPISDNANLTLIRGMILAIGCMLIGKKLIDDERDAVGNRTFTTAKDRQPPGQG